MSDDMFYCSFVSIHYIICECGETFPSEEDLKNHLEKEHAHKKEKKEYKCGIVSIYQLYLMMDVTRKYCYDLVKRFVCQHSENCYSMDKEK